MSPPPASANLPLGSRFCAASGSSSGNRFRFRLRFPSPEGGGAAALRRRAADSGGSWWFPAGRFSFSDGVPSLPVSPMDSVVSVNSSSLLPSSAGSGEEGRPLGSASEGGSDGAGEGGGSDGAEGGSEGSSDGVISQFNFGIESET